MELKTPYPKPGDRVRLKHCGPFRLPSCLDAGQEVTVVAEQKGPFFTVKDDSGTVYKTVAGQCLCLERLYRYKGEWVPENNPVVLAHLRQMADELEATRGEWQSGIEWVNEELIRYSREALRRWGAKVSER